MRPRRIKLHSADRVIQAMQERRELPPDYYDPPEPEEDDEDTELPERMDSSTE
jgi:hypothetical protein